jgi:hypothetical protein
MDDLEEHYKLGLSSHLGVGHNVINTFGRRSTFVLCQYKVSLGQHRSKIFLGYLRPVYMWPKLHSF